MNDDIKWLVIRDWTAEKAVVGRFEKYDEALKFKRQRVRHYGCNWNDYAIVEAD